jgi:hypothetical protein
MADLNVINQDFLREEYKKASERSKDFEYQKHLLKKTILESLLKYISLNYTAAIRFDWSTSQQPYLIANDFDKQVLTEVIKDLRENHKIYAEIHIVSSRMSEDGILISRVDIIISKDNWL